MVRDFGDSTQFEYLYDAITENYPGVTGDPGGASVFQFVTTPMRVAWTTGTDAEAYDIANAVPLDLSGFYSPGDALDAAYKSLICYIKPADYSDNKDYTNKQSILSGLRNSLTKTIQNANDAYATWVANNKNSDGTAAESRQDWLADEMGGLAWGDQIKDLNKQIDTANSKLAAIIASMDSALANALTASTTDTMNITFAGTTIAVPRMSISGDLGGDLGRWAAYSPGEYDFQVIINRERVTKHPWKHIHTTKSQMNCWSASANVDVNTSRIIEDVNYNLEVDIIGVNSYKLRGESGMTPLSSLRVSLSLRERPVSRTTVSSASMGHFTQSLSLFS